ncbi:HAMP domain protein [mine drainage metagenome]|uniref:HAMP domain protein n=1 Tax=mine drainage metagenome TaxID=410659 RepID=A0A1J5RMT4_9ZZZZ
MRIGSRLSLGFGSICLVVTIVSGISLFESLRVQFFVNNIVELRSPASQSSANIGAELFISLSDLRGYILTKDDKFKTDRAQAWERISRLEDKIDKLSSHFSNEKNVNLWDAAKSNLYALKKAQSRVEAAPTTDLQIKILKEAAFPHAEKLQTIFYGDVAADGRRTGGLIENQKNLLESDAGSVFKSAEFMKLTSVFSILFGLALSVVITVFTKNSVVTPIKNVSSSMKLIAGGDLSAHIPHREDADEVGEMAAALGLFQTSLVKQRELEIRQREEEQNKAERAVKIAKMTEDFDQSAGNTVQAVAAAAHQLQALAEGLSKAATETSRKTSSVSEASETASANVQTVASAAERAGLGNSDRKISGFFA